MGYPTRPGEGGAEYGDWTALRDRFGIRRSTGHELLAEGKIRAVKHGRRTLIEFASVRAYLASLPSASARKAA